MKADFLIELLRTANVHFSQYSRIMCDWGLIYHEWSWLILTRKVSRPFHLSVYIS
jgi:hypothetical protein